MKDTHRRSQRGEAATTMDAVSACRSIGVLGSPDMGAVLETEVPL
jgi:hypothetical protein